jgi:hypothetical protein
MAKTTLFSDIETNEELAAHELDSGSTGGGFISKCGVYPTTIEKAFLTTTKKGGVQLDLHFGGENSFVTKLYPVIVKDGKKVTTYTYKGKAMSLGDYKLLKQLLYVTNGKAIDLADMETVEETITYKEYGKDITVDAETCVDLVGKNVMIGVRLSEKYAWNTEEAEVDKTQLKTNSDGDIVYDKVIFSVYSQTGKTPTEIIKKEEATQMAKDKEFLEGDKGIKKVKLEAAKFEEEELALEDELDF